MIAWFLWACLGSTPGDDSSATEVRLSTPTFEALTWDCSTETDRWELAARASSWTAGALLVWTVDTVYIEEHELGSTESAGDGSWDELELTLTIVADPRDVARSSATAFLCDAPTQQSLGLRVALLAPETEEETDCRTGGAVVDFEGLGYDACPDRWERE